MELTAAPAAAAEAPPLVADTHGACLPTAGGSTADRLYMLSIASLRRPALVVLGASAAQTQGWIRGSLETLERAVAGLPASEFIAAFRPAVAFRHLDPGNLTRDPLTAALGLVRFLVGGPNAGVLDLGLVVPPHAFPAGGLYFPHLNMMVDAGGGPLAIQADAQGVRFTWVDGVCATVPPDGFEEPVALFDPPRLHGLERAAGWPVFNRTPDAHDPLLGLSPGPTPVPEPGALAALGQADALLYEVWPEAWSATRRFYNAALSQPVPEGHVHSVTVDKLQGAFIASFRDAVQIADGLVHEGSHARLALFFRVDPLIADDGAAVHHSPWRSDPRPLKGLLNGIHSFVNVCLFFQRLGERHPDIAEHAQQTFALQRGKVHEAWAYLAPRARPTALGAHFLTDLERAVAAL